MVQGYLCSGIGCELRIQVCSQQGLWVDVYVVGIDKGIDIVLNNVLNRDVSKNADLAVLC